LLFAGAGCGWQGSVLPQSSLQSSKLLYSSRTLASLAFGSSVLQALKLATAADATNINGKLCEIRRLCFCCVFISIPSFTQRFFNESELPL
jgi:hypothetical protein